MAGVYVRNSGLENPDLIRPQDETGQSQSEKVPSQKFPMFCVMRLPPRERIEIRKPDSTLLL